MARVFLSNPSKTFEEWYPNFHHSLIDRRMPRLGEKARAWIKDTGITPLYMHHRTSTVYPITNVPYQVFKEPQENNYLVFSSEYNAMLFKLSELI